MPRVAQLKINLACGSVFVTGDGWINLDYSPFHPAVQRADLLNRLPLQDDSAALTYSSHFLEHIPRPQVPAFLAECWRILAPGGVLRLVLPDLDNLCRAYLTHRERGEHKKADFVVLEMIDQCVRRESGGELGQLYRQMKSAPDRHLEMIDFVRERTGEHFLAEFSEVSALPSLGGAKLVQRLRGRAKRVWTKGVLQLLPKAFQLQNVSLASDGECHHWLWDFYQLQQVLQEIGFVAIERCEASLSRFTGFPFEPLDINSDGLPRKGAESMYVEAQKPDE